MTLKLVDTCQGPRIVLAHKCSINVNYYFCVRKYAYHLDTDISRASFVVSN